MAMRAWLFIFLLTILTGCAHKIQVNPLPSGPTPNTIPRSLQLTVGPLWIEGADHMPGITLLEWPHRDLSHALIQYVQQRKTFSSVSTNPAGLTLNVTTKLSMKSRERYRYRIQLEAEIREPARPIKMYLVEHEAAGSFIRWVTASDRDPIETALQLALDDVLTQIEADRSLFVMSTGRPTK